MELCLCAWRKGVIFINKNEQAIKYLTMLCESPNEKKRRLIKEMRDNHKEKRSTNERVR